MKKTIIILITIFLLVSCKSSKDWFKLSRTEQQNILFDRGVKKMDTRNLYISLQSFHGAQFLDSVSNLSNKSRHYIDSLLPIYCAEKTKMLKGLWELKELHYDPSPGSFCDYIKFEDSVVKFYSNLRNSQLRLVRTERILYQAYDPLELFFTPYKLIFSNGEIWSFSLETKKSHAKLYPKIERTKDGKFPILLDERGIIRDQKKTKRRA